jgi:hypothetical protein
LYFKFKEAMMREEILNQKLKSLQTFIDQAKGISENGWLVNYYEKQMKFLIMLQLFLIDVTFKRLLFKKIDFCRELIV